jgi:hypothetical protein
MWGNLNLQFWCPESSELGRTTNHVHHPVFHKTKPRLSCVYPTLFFPSYGPTTKNSQKIRGFNLLGVGSRFKRSLGDKVLLLPYQITNITNLYVKRKLIKKAVTLTHPTKQTAEESRFFKVDPGTMWISYGFLHVMLWIAELSCCALTAHSLYIALQGVMKTGENLAGSGDRMCWKIEMKRKD